MNVGLTSPSLVTPLNTDENWMFGFHLYWYILWRWSQPIAVLCDHHLTMVKNFLILEKPNHIWMEEMLEFVQKLFSMVFPLVLNGLWSKLAFLILYEKYWMSFCTTCLISHSDMSLVMDPVNLLGILLIIAWISPKTQELFLIKTMRVILLSCCMFIITIGLIQLFLNPLLCHQIDTQTL